MGEEVSEYIHKSMSDSSNHAVTAVPAEYFRKKTVLNDAGEEFEVIEILVEGIEDHAVFIYCMKDYIRRVYGEMGVDYETAIFPFTRRKIYTDADLLKPMYQGVEIENNDHSKFWIYFEIPKKKLV